MLLASKLLEILHAMHHIWGFHRGRRRNARIGMQKACKRHAGKRLVAQGILIRILSLGERNFGTQAFRLANLATRLKLLGTLQVPFQVLHGRLAHHGKFFGKAERKVLGRNIHQHGVLRHVKFSLAGVHVFLRRIVGGINLETGKDGPNNRHSCIEEPVVLNLHAKIGVVNFLGRLETFCFGSLLDKGIRLGVPHNSTTDFIGLLVHHALRGCLVKPSSHGLFHGIVIGVRIGQIVCGKVCPRIGGSPGHFAQGALKAAQVDRNRVINLRYTRSERNFRHKARPCLGLPALRHFDLGLLRLYLRVIRFRHFNRFL